MTEVLIAGGGPAGWSLASACARRGLGVTLVAATQGWPATYGMWVDETGVLPPGARWVTARPRGMTRDYAVLDNESVLAGFSNPGIDVVKGRVEAFTATRVRLTDGSVLTGDIVFDATGVLGAVDRVEQTAYGVVVEAAGVVGTGEAASEATTATGVVRGKTGATGGTRAAGEVVASDRAGAAGLVMAAGEAVFMDWRQPPGFGEPATFLYAVPLPGGRVLLEETCLARRPGLGFGELKARLHARLGPVAGPVERVRFPVDVPPPPRRARGAIPFGAAGGFVHPATGFSLGDTFRLAPLVADTIGRGPSAVRRVLWPERARIVYQLRRRGLATLLGLTAAEHEEFFELFFALSPRRQRAYLSGRTDVVGTAAAMVAMFRAAPAHLRRKMITP